MKKIMLFVGAVIAVVIMTGGGHNTGAFTIGTRINAGLDPQNATANISYTDGYTIKYDYMMGQWGCFAPNGNMVANGGYGDSPVGATWYEMVNWSGAEVSLELYG